MLTVLIFRVNSNCVRVWRSNNPHTEPAQVIAKNKCPAAMYLKITGCAKSSAWPSKNSCELKRSAMRSNWEVPSQPIFSSRFVFFGLKTQFIAEAKSTANVIIARSEIFDEPLSRYEPGRMEESTTMRRPAMMIPRKAVMTKMKYEPATIEPNARIRRAQKRNCRILSGYETRDD